MVVVKLPSDDKVKVVVKSCSPFLAVTTVATVARVIAVTEENFIFQLQSAGYLGKKVEKINVLPKVCELEVKKKVFNVQLNA